MIYYISKPVSHKLDETLQAGIRHIDPEATFVQNLYKADICILQKGWTRSKVCVADYHLARENHIECREGYLYTDKFKPTLN